MENSENPQFPYKIGDIIEIDVPSFLQRRSAKIEHKLHVAGINYFDALVSSDEYKGKRFALIVDTTKGHWADKIVVAYPLSPSAVKRGWGTFPLPPVVSPKNQSTCGLDGDYVVALMQFNVWTHWIKKKLGSVDAEFLSALPYKRQTE
ncbi:hypothetical protein KF728_04310 [Candidatus Obscuribacterales bacterium]|nr:hypothetical protein [Candidatus Obscuribacterales bacterium]